MCLREMGESIHMQSPDLFTLKKNYTDCHQSCFSRAVVLRRDSYIVEVYEIIHGCVRNLSVCIMPQLKDVSEFY